MKKTIITLSVLIVIGILGFVAYNFLFASKVPQVFLDKYNEAVKLDKEYVKISTDVASSPEMNELDNKIEKMDYDGALNLIDTISTEKNKALSKLKSASEKIAEAKTMLGKITDSNARTYTEKMIGYLEKENAAKVKFTTLQIQLLDKSKEQNSYLKSKNGILSASDKTVDNLGKQIDAITKQIDDTKSEIDNIQSQYKQIEEGFLKSAGLSTDVVNN